MLKTIFVEMRKTFLKTFALVFAALFLLVLGISMIVTHSVNKATQSKLLSNEQTLLNAERVILSSRLNKITGDLIFIRDSLLLNEENELGYNVLAREWIAFSRSRQIYDQIRFIDVDGNEVIRVNYSGDGPVLVGTADLQNKKNRGYFSETISLNENQIYISKLDLNIENNEIEEPLKPVLRLSMPYYDRSGQLKGIVILNYLAEDMFRQIRLVSSAGSGSTFMLNSDGYWVYNSSDAGREWAFMYNDRQNVRFSAEFPSVWDEIAVRDSGYTVNSDGLFVYTKFVTSAEFAQPHANYQLVLGSGDWVLVSYLPSSSESGAVFTQTFHQFLLDNLGKSGLFYLIILPVAFTIAILEALNENKKRKVKYFSEFDAMTGVYNRRAGLEKIEKLMSSSRGGCTKSSVCFIDINGLKEVNDTLGHDAGDALIKTIVEVIKKHTRENDIIARLGGDEFLIIFEGIDAGQAEEIWNRVTRAFAQINETENRAYLVSVSHGIEAFDCGIQRRIDHVISLADEKMYREKILIKKTLRVIRNAPSV